MIIDASNLIVGRIATVVAKRSLLGEDMNVVNCRDAVFTGKKSHILARYRRFMEMGNPSTGPFVHRSPDKLVKKVIRGMLPYKQPKGRDAFKRIRCYSGVPEILKDKEAITLEGANVSKVPSLYHMKVGEISKLIGGKD